MIKAFRAVFWAFFGVRKGEDHKNDIASLKLTHVIFAGILGTIIFIITLLGIIKFIVL